MILDKLTNFAAALAMNTGAAGTYLLGDVVDLGAGSSLFDPDDIYLVLGVDTTATSGGSATAQFALVSDAAAAIATNGSAIQHYITPAIPVATLVAGYQIACLELPKGFPLYKRYLGILQVTGVAAFTAGKVNAFLTKDPAVWRAVADGVN